MKYNYNLVKIIHDTSDKGSPYGMSKESLMKDNRYSLRLVSAMLKLGVLKEVREAHFGTLDKGLSYQEVIRPVDIINKLMGSTTLHRYLSASSLFFIKYLLAPLIVAYVIWIITK